MTGPGHQAINVMSAVAIGQTAGLKLAQQAILVGAMLMTASSPDIDLKLPIRHRGPTHWIELHVLVAVGVYLFANAYIPDYATLIAGGVFLGLVMHTLMDATTPDGVEISLIVLLIRRARRRSRCVHILPFRIRVTTGPARTPGAYFSIPQPVALMTVGIAEAGYLWMLYGT